MILLTACGKQNVIIEDCIDDISEYQTQDYILPKTVLVLLEGSTTQDLRDIDVTGLSMNYVYDSLDASTGELGTYIMGRYEIEKIVSILLYEKHTINTRSITNNFIYLHMDYDNYSYILWWNNNQLMVIGDFVTLRGVLEVT